MRNKTCASCGWTGLHQEGCVAVIAAAKERKLIAMMAVKLIGTSWGGISGNRDRASEAVDMARAILAEIAK